MVAEFALSRRLQAETQLPANIPANIEVEEVFLGSLLIDENAWDRVSGIGISEKSFTIPSHKEIFKVITELRRRGTTGTFPSVEAFIRDNNLSAITGGIRKLTALLEVTVSSVNIDEYAQLLKGYEQRRNIIEIAERIKERAANQTYSIDEIEPLEAEMKANLSAGKGVDFRRLQIQMEELEEEDNVERDFQLKRLAKEYGFSGLREMKSYYSRWLLSQNKPRVFSLSEYREKCKAIKIDWILPGWIPRNSLICCYGTGGVGKTRTIFSIIRHLIDGSAWGSFSPNRPMRILLVQSDQGALQNHQIFDMQEFYSLPSEYLDNLAIIENWSVANNGQLKKAIDNHRADLVVIDSLTSVSRDGIVSENDVPFAAPLIHWRQIADQSNCSFLVLHHANKGGQMRGTTAIFNTVDEVWKLEKPLGKTGENILRIEKTRSRGPGDYLLKYNDLTWKWEIEDGEMEGDRLVPTSGIEREILSLLSDGKNRESEEIAAAVNAAASTVRKHLGSLQRQGLVSQIKSGRSRPVYFSSSSPTGGDPGDPGDPEVIRDNGSPGNTLPENDPEDKKASDPVIRDFFVDQPQEKEKKITDHRITSDQDTLNPLAQADPGGDPPSRITSGSPGSPRITLRPEAMSRYTVDHQAEIERLKPLIRTCISEKGSICPIEFSMGGDAHEIDVTAALQEMETGGEVEKFIGDSLHDRRWRFPKFQPGQRHRYRGEWITIIRIENDDLATWIHFKDDRGKENFCRSEKLEEEQEGDRLCTGKVVEALLPSGEWAMVTVTRVFAKTFWGEAFGEEYKGLTEWR